MTDIDAQELLNQTVKLYVRPLSQVITQLAAVLVKEGCVTKSQAIFSVANAVSTITDTKFSFDAKEDAASVLQAMIDALNGLPDQEKADV